MLGLGLLAGIATNILFDDKKRTNYAHKRKRPFDGHGYDYDYDYSKVRSFDRPKPLGRDHVVLTNEFSPLLRIESIKDVLSFCIANKSFYDVCGDPDSYYFRVFWNKWLDEEVVERNEYIYPNRAEIMKEYISDASAPARIKLKFVEILVLRGHNVSRFPISF